MDHRSVGILGVARFLSAYVFPIAALLFLWGCASPETPAVVSDKDVMLFLKPGLRPETLLFPEYLLMEDFELDAHGWIPETPLVGGGLKRELGLKTVLRQYNQVLATHGWRVAKAEIAKQSFRLMAAKKTETLEIRAVQGTGSPQIFILYKPASAD
jgi:hypothetical protein